MLKLCENGSNIDYLYETSSVLRKATETEISGLTFWLRFCSVRVFKNRTEIRFPHITTSENVTQDVRSLCFCILEPLTLLPSTFCDHSATATSPTPYQVQERVGKLGRSAHTSVTSQSPTAILLGPPKR